MASVLLINCVVREFAPPNNAPLGTLYIAAVLEANGHTVTICDLNALRAKDSNREFWLHKYMKPYDFIGLSGLITTYQEQRRGLDYIVTHYTGFGEPILVSGGGLATSVPEFAFKWMPELSFLVIGEGEQAMLELIDGKTPPWEIQGIAYRGARGEFVRTVRNYPNMDLDSLPLPAWGKVPISQYLHNPIWGGEAKNSSKIDFQSKHSMNVICTRGCPYACGFCYHEVLGHRHRQRSPQNVIDEMFTLKEKYEVDFIGFTSDNATVDRDWMIELCQGLMDKNAGLKWGCHARVDGVDPEMLGWMKYAGCEFIGFGIESASDVILKRMNKKTDTRTAKFALEMVRDAGIYPNATFIAGYPGETRETLRETAKFMKDNKCLNSMFYATAYPGTALYEEVKPKILAEYGSEDAYIMDLGDATELKVNLSEMETDELVECRNKAMEGKTI